MQYENELKFYASHIRESKQDYDKIVLEGNKRFTNWMDIDNLSEIEEDFITKIQFDNLERSDFYKFYNNYLESIVQHDAAMLVGAPVNLPIDEIERIYDEISLLDEKIKEIEKEISEEENFNRQMDLNMEAHKFKVKKEDFINELRGE